MIKKAATIILLALLISPVNYAKSATDNLAKGNKYYSSAKYEKAVTEYKKEVVQDKTNKKAAEGIIKSYTAIGDIYYKNSEYGKAALNYRNALFYVQLYAAKTNSTDFIGEYKTVQNSYKQCLKNLKIKDNAKNHYNMGRLLSLLNEYTAASYEYSLAQNGKYKTDCEKAMEEMYKKAGLENK